MIRRVLLALALLSGCVQLYSQGGVTAPPGALYVVFDWQVTYTCAPWTVSCVPAINGIPVCPYGRVAAIPINVPGFPPQPYTSFTYPKVDQNGQPIDMTKCVSTLPPGMPWFINGGNYQNDPALHAVEPGEHY